jgi:hypothetical protein
MKNFANVSKTSRKKKCQSFILNIQNYGPQYRILTGVKIISPIETDVSEARVATQLGFSKS